MLAELTVKDLTLIDEISLPMRPGLNIITGETGAGKSIVIEAINLLVGGRADSTRIRQGSDAAEINGLFLLGKNKEHALRRFLSRDGRNRCFIDGRPVTTGQINDIGDTLLDIHGQHEHQVLLNPQKHLDLIDRFGGEDIRAAKEAYRVLDIEYRKKQQEAADLKAEEAARSDRREILAWQIEELSNAGLTLGEDEELKTKIDRMKNFARIYEAVDKARRAVDDAAIDAAQSALAEINRVVEADEQLIEIAGLLDAAAANLEESGCFMRNYCREMEFEESSLEACQERLFMLSDLKKKYGLSIEGLVAHLDSARSELDEIDGSAAAEDLDREVERLSFKVAEAAGILRDLRTAAGERFVELVQAHLQELALPVAEFSIRFGGGKSAEFIFSANAGEELKPLARIASGGEISRVMLAIRTVFGESDATPTLVFDEIDAGIGGKTAVKVGEHLSALGRCHQVICVTHLAQIAAFADHHLAVTKNESGGKTSMEVRTVSGVERLRELSRLGGALSESEISVEHARELLSQAQAQKSAVSG